MNVLLFGHLVTIEITQRPARPSSYLHIFPTFGRALSKMGIVAGARFIGPIQHIPPANAFLCWPLSKTCYAGKTDL